MLRMTRRFSDLPKDLAELEVKLMTMSAADFLDEWFESDKLKAPMSCSGIIGTSWRAFARNGLCFASSLYGEIDGAFRSWGFCRGGNGAVSEALASAARSYGAEIRTNAAVSHIQIAGQKATGVVLANGDELSAKVVCSSLDPHATFFNMVGKDNLSDEFAGQISRFKMRGSSGKVNLALDRLPEFSSRPGRAHLRGDIAIAPSIDYLERAYQDAKYGDFSKRPYLNVVIPTLFDPQWHRRVST